MAPSAYAYKNSSDIVKSGPGVLYYVTVTAGSNAISCTIYDNTAGSGSVIGWVYCPANDIRHVMLGPAGVAFGKGLYLTISGTGGGVAVGYR